MCTCPSYCTWPKCHLIYEAFPSFLQRPPPRQGLTSSGQHQILLVSAAGCLRCSWWCLLQRKATCGLFAPGTSSGGAQGTCSGLALIKGWPAAGAHLCVCRGLVSSVRFFRISL